MIGFDASGRVDDLAAELNKRISSIAIGSAEGFSQAERAINAACKSGHFCMLKVINFQVTVVMNAFQFQNQWNH